MPPPYARPPMLKPAWNNGESNGEPVTKTEPVKSQPANDSSFIEDTEDESDVNSTFIVETAENNLINKPVMEINRCSTPEQIELYQPVPPKVTKPQVIPNKMPVPPPPDCPKPRTDDPRNAKIIHKYIQFQKTQIEQQNVYENKPNDKGISL